MSLLPERATRAFPLLLLILLAGLALVLNRMTELPYFSPNVAQRDPDLVIQRFVATEYGIDGQPRYRLNAVQMRHYPDEHAELSAARLHRTETGSAPMTVSADTARMDQKGNQLLLQDNVQVQTEAYGKQAPMTLRTSSMQLDTKTGAAKSDAPAVVESNGDVLRTVGFDYDHEQAHLKLRAKVSIDYAITKH